MASGCAERMKLSVKIGQRDEKDEVAQYKNLWPGMTVVKITDGIRKEAGIDKGVEGGRINHTLFHQQRFQRLDAEFRLRRRMLVVVIVIGVDTKVAAMVVEVDMTVIGVTVVAVVGALIWLVAMINLWGMR